MSLRPAAVAIVVLAVTTVFAQQSAPVSAPAAAPTAGSQGIQRPMPMRRWGKGAEASKQTGPVNPVSLQQRVQDLQSTVSKMRTVLKQMQGKSAASAKDPVAKANLQMWELMVSQLDKELEELKQAEASRVDMEARRAAMYKQAEIKSQAEARAAQQAMFSKQPTGAPAATPASPSSTPAASQTPAPSAAPSTSASPN
jgi:hypothetical protein